MGSGESGENSYSRFQSFASKWGWYQSIYALAKGDVRRFDDITKLGVNACLTMLSFEQEKAKLESDNIKSKFKK